VGVSRDGPIFSTPISQEGVKLRTSNLAGIFKVSMRTKARYKFGRKGSVGVSGDFPFFEYPLLSQERIKLRTSNLAGIFTGSIRAKALKISEKRELGRIQGLSKIFQ